MSLYYSDPRFKVNAYHHHNLKWQLHQDQHQNKQNRNDDDDDDVKDDDDDNNNNK